MRRSLCRLEELDPRAVKVVELPLTFRVWLDRKQRLLASARNLSCDTEAG
jgi:hypothetical protein